MGNKKLLFSQLLQFIKDGDHISLNHLLKWEYKKEILFQLKNDDGLTLIHTACLEGQLNCLYCLLENGASVHSKSSVGWNALHAATLGGNIQLVTFLLNECSADPLERDDMGCLPSDLTMDKDILKILNKWAEEATVRKETEAQDTAIIDLPRRRTQTFACKQTVSTRTNLPTRAQSLIVEKSNAAEIRKHFSQNSSGIVKKDYLQVPLTLGKQRRHSNGTDYDYNSNIVITKSETQAIHQDVIKSSGSSTSTTSDIETKERHNENIIRKKAIRSTTSVTAPKAVKFFTTDRPRKQETKNRDSGVFDEEIETLESSLQGHYKVI